MSIFPEWKKIFDIFKNSTKILENFQTEIQIKDDLTIHYNDVSVLENHHAYICCQLLRTEETKISCYLSRADQRELRKIIITVRESEF